MNEIKTIMKEYEYFLILSISTWISFIGKQIIDLKDDVYNIGIANDYLMINSTLNIGMVLFSVFLIYPWVFKFKLKNKETRKVLDGRKKAWFYTIIRKGFRKKDKVRNYRIAMLSLLISGLMISLYSTTVELKKTEYRMNFMHKKLIEEYENKRANEYHIEKQKNLEKKEIETICKKDFDNVNKNCEK